MNIEVNGKTLSATLENNSSAEALVKLIGNKPLSISLDDYAGFEKTGNLPEALPTNDKKTDTDYGDIILYQGINSLYTTIKIHGLLQSLVILII